MTQATQQPKTTVLAANVGAAIGAAAPIEEVITLLRDADKIADTMHGKLKAAAALAGPQMVPSFGVAAKVEQALAVYAVTWLEITDPNVKRDFTNLLWIYADPKAQVTVPKAVAKGAAPETQIIDAILCLTLSKRVITDVSKQIRDIHDAGRAAGAGRPAKVPAANTGTLPAAPAAAPALTPAAPLNPAVSQGTQPAAPAGTNVLPQSTPSVAPAPQPAKVSAAAPTFFEELVTRMKNPGDAAKILQIIEAEGYKVTRAANVTPAAATVDATAKLAEKLLETTPETAIQQAAKLAAEKRTSAAKGSKAGK